MKIDIYKASLITNYKRKKEKQVCSEKNGTKNRGSQDTIENEKIEKEKKFRLFQKHRTKEVCSSGGCCRHYMDSLIKCSCSEHVKRKTTLKYDNEQCIK
jgi:hypothetical protein